MLAWKSGPKFRKQPVRMKTGGSMHAQRLLNMNGTANMSDLPLSINQSYLGRSLLAFPVS